MDRKILTKKPKKKLLISAAVLLVGIWGYVKIANTSVSSFKVDSSRISYAQASQGQFTESLPIYGLVAPVKSVFLDTVQGGVIDEILIEEGTMVGAGQPILKFKNTSFELQVFSQEARISEQLDINANTRLSLEQNRLDIHRKLNNIELDVKLKKREIERTKPLMEKGYIAENHYLNLLDKYDQLIKSLELNREAETQDEEIRIRKFSQLAESEKRLNSHLEVIRESLEQLVVKAPIAGQITSLPIEIGELKKVGDRLGQIDVMDGYKVSAFVDSFYLSRVEKGQTAYFVADGVQKKLTVKKVYSEINDGQFQVDLDFVDTAPEHFVRGQNINLELILSEPQQAVMIDNGGFFQDTGGDWVFVVDPNGNTATKRPVKLGKRNNKKIVVLEGIELGERIIVSSYSDFTDVDQLVIN
ncbi:HlyD family efflux transporter periplasmic adaptor subunit [Pseudoalteromonas sp. MMG013]|uniref:efflux RND transporter periplasmic adaptor subunit n=1 Tax=Pseudoalteromonas sp. MMG013 TaxID=2822687 RepID=UPI001B381867|nr:HlyD family efflux transporter periplasmic adaptor subunit [Pseudoalteromonas sp. MMG013]MBQ4862193.1 HlyD family efflux transporter periplasmic adaptor subunit [Pseudoalteromonas sp. MMG013]